MLAKAVALSGATSISDLNFKAVLETFRKLSTWNKWGFCGSIASVIALPLAVYFYYASPSTGSQVIASENRGTVVGGGNHDVIINPTPLPRKVNWQLMAQSSRVAADSFRNLAESYMPAVVPAKWTEAEKLYLQGTEQYERSDYEAADRSFDKARSIYQDLWSKYNGAHH